MRFLFLSLFFGMLTLSAFTVQAQKDSMLYRRAMQQAVYPEPDKVSDQLISITPENASLVRKTINGEEYILTVSWKQNVSYYKNDPNTGFYNTGDYQIWITTAPELKERVKTLKYKDIDHRLKQLLGLPPSSQYSYFVEFWVRPQDLFRPCPDNEITDKKCDLCFPKNATKDYINWINQSRGDRYYQCELYQQYPWTQLGYTYDWNPKNKNHQGLSEFVIDVNKNIVVNKIYTTKEYLGLE